MARPKEFDQEKALRKAIRLFSQQGFAATSTDDLMRVMDIGRQSMYDTFGDKRALFLKALKMYVAQSVHSINVELERPGSALSAIQNALVTFAERKDLSSAEGCIGLNAITEFGRQDADVTRILRDAARVLRQALMHVLARAKNQREISSNSGLDSMADFFETSFLVVNRGMAESLPRKLWISCRCGRLSWVHSWCTLACKWDDSVQLRTC
jgi:TetR/AcrR family transcriptional regulator, transcriptional repressor for nem operon